MKERQMLAHMEVAHVYAKLSYCNRLKVGCIVISPEGDRVISIGYNGTPAGEDNICELPDNTTKPNVIHAEDNALRKLNPNDTIDSHVFCTHSPCQPCAELLVAAGIKSFFFKEIYRDTQPLDYLIEQGIEVKQI